tara:strand:- start:5908 stop:6627 length:720 start_codon:yes stop_codon:yes gene_type:complete
MLSSILAPFVQIFDTILGQSINALLYATVCTMDAFESARVYAIRDQHEMLLLFYKLWEALLQRIIILCNYALPTVRHLLEEQKDRFAAHQEATMMHHRNPILVFLVKYHNIMLYLGGFICLLAIFMFFIYTLRKIFFMHLIADIIAYTSIKSRNVVGLKAAEHIREKSRKTWLGSTISRLTLGYKRHILAPLEPGLGDILDESPDDLFEGFDWEPEETAATQSSAPASAAPRRNPRRGE